MATPSTAAQHDQHEHDDHGPKEGFFHRWFMSTNHKDIGTLYLLFSLLMFFIGGSMAMAIRLELFQEDNRWRFRARVVERNEIVLDRGIVRIR